MTSTGNVRGASTPFQFRSLTAEDYLEVLDSEDADMMVIKTKTALFEEKLETARIEKEALLKVNLHYLLFIL